MFNLLAQVDLAHAVSNTVANGDLDLSQIAQLSNGNPMVMLALGAVGILGGKKAWDWLKQRQEQKHEEKLAEIEAQKTSLSTGHEPCVAKQQELETQVVALKGKISGLQGKVDEAEKILQTTVSNANENFTVITEEVKKLKKKVKKLKEEQEEQEEEKSRRKPKKKSVRDDDDE